MRTGSSWQGARGTPGAKPGAARKRDGGRQAGSGRGGVQTREILGHGRCSDMGKAQTWDIGDGGPG